MYSRELDGETLTFRVSGKLWKGNALIMFDTRTETLWLHTNGLAIKGPLAGKRLRTEKAIPIILWKHWRELHPDTTVFVWKGMQDAKFMERVP